MRRSITGTVVLILIFSALVIGRPALPVAAQHTNLTPLISQDISLDQAQEVLAAAIAAAEEQGILMDVAVVDAGGNLKTFARMDGAWLGSIDIAAAKARTARYFDLPTEALGELSQPGGPLYGIEVSNGGLITFPGGLPLKSPDGVIIGAIGVSGSTVENDHAVAAAGASALGDANVAAALPGVLDLKSGGGGARGGVVQ